MINMSSGAPVVHSTPAPPVSVERSGLNALAIGPSPNILATTYDTVRQWLRPGAPQYRTFPLPVKANQQIASIVNSTVQTSVVTGNFLPIVGGTLTGPLYFANTVGPFVINSGSVSPSILSGDLFIKNPSIATALGNFNSPSLFISGTSWTGSASQTDAWSIENEIGSGTNPTSKLKITHTGTSGAVGVEADGYFSSGLGYLINGATPTTGHVLRSNGTYFVDGQVSFADITGTLQIGQTPLTTLGDILYANSTPALARLAGNITTTKKFLSQTGTSSVSAAPAWAALAAGDIPNLDASKITTGQLALARGGTGADLSATGGAHEVLLQSTLGGTITVGQLAYSDISGTISPGSIVSGTANRTTQTANVSATTLLATGTNSGLYLVTVFIVISQAASSTSTLPDSRIIWTDEDSGATITVPLTSGLTGNTTSTFAQATFLVNAKASTNIQFDIGQVTAYASSGGTPMQFAYRARAVYLG